MSALLRWDPFKEMEDLQSRFAKLFGLTPARISNGGKEALTVAEWAPSVDITEDDREYLVKADLPEVKKEDVKVTVQGRRAESASAQDREGEGEGRRSQSSIGRRTCLEQRTDEGREE